MTYSSHRGQQLSAPCTWCKLSAPPRKTCDSFTAGARTEGRTGFPDSFLSRFQRAPSEVLWPEVDYSLAVSFTRSEVSQGCTGTAVLAFQLLNCVTEYGSGFHGRRPAAVSGGSSSNILFCAAQHFPSDRRKKRLSAPHTPSALSLEQRCRVLRCCDTHGRLHTHIHVNKTMLLSDV